MLWCAVLYCAGMSQCCCQWVTVGTSGWHYLQSLIHCHTPMYCMLCCVVLCRHEPVLLSARDREDIRMAAANQVTYVSVPFVRTAEDVIEVSPLGMGVDRVSCCMARVAPMCPTLMRNF